MGQKALVPREELNALYDASASNTIWAHLELALAPGPRAKLRTRMLRFERRRAFGGPLL